MTVFFSGGGTAGHIYAGIALADRLKSIFPEAQIHFVGARGGMEERLVPKSGYPLHRVRIGSWNGVSVSRKLRTLAQIPWSFVQAFALLLKYRPQIIFGVGGYASFPVVLIAGLISWIWGGKVAVLEQNVLPGLTNRILGRVSSKVFAAFPGSEKVFGQKKVMVTGNPIRLSIKRLTPASRDPFTVFIFGGSQGAVGINSLVIEALPFLQKQGIGSGGELRFIHQTGERDFDRVRAAHERFGFKSRVEKFIYDMPECYAQSSLLICRAGSSTLSEIAAVGRAAVLVPLVSKDRHQEYNAELFCKSGASELRLQPNTSGEQLAQLIRELSQDAERIESMEKSVIQFSRPDAVDRILSELIPGLLETPRI
ncbi:MAG: undecaprenyldiphospho-muramoylpentapeptide beta-N-acetylglucosaminyltransferase [Bdellovibrionales bacterium]|nr:undecaprenyldiphospho-muramoylpentapeptide beta-N-acetylglucosaminyltransferase [Bdellovibrionales bacterium]